MQYDLVFQGGGAKGMAFVGAMEEFEQRKHSFRRLVGTSAGAINAALLAAGYDSADMAVALNETVDGKPVFESFLAPPEIDKIDSEVFKNSLTIQCLSFFAGLAGGEAGSNNWAQNVLENAGGDAIKLILSLIDDEKIEDYTSQAFSLVELGGLYHADHFVTWLSGKLREKNPEFAGANLATFYELTEVDLSLCATDISGQKLLVLNHRTAPNLPLVWAVRMSMSIPFVWPPVIWQENWGMYNEGGNKTNMMGHRIVDGGALSNFAIRLTTSAESSVRAVMSDNPDIKHKEYAEIVNDCPTIGFTLDAELEVPAAGEPPAGGDEGWLARTFKSIGGWAQEYNQNQPANILLLLGDTVNTMMTGNDNFTIATQQDNVCRLPVKGYGTLEFDMTPERKEALVNAAKEATRHYLQDRLEFMINDLYLGVNEEGHFQIGCNINGEPHPNDWIGLFKSPDEHWDDCESGNWARLKPGDNICNTITKAELGQYEARYYAYHSWGWFGLTEKYKPVKCTGPLNRVVAL